MSKPTKKPTKKQQITVQYKTANDAQIAANRARMAKAEREAMRTRKATIIPLDAKIEPFNWARSVGK